jgi:predicted ATPase
LALKGLGEISAHRLLEVIPGAAGHARRLDSPLVDRERESALLRETFERTVAGRQCQLFTVLGAAGVGKSRLVEEFLTTAGARAVALRGRCLPYGEGITFWPIIEIVTEAAGLADSDPPAEAGRKIARVVAGERRGEQAAERVAQVIGIGEGSAGADETFWAIRTFLEALARRQPLVVMLDDVHWAEPTLLDLIDHVADWSKDVPIMVIALSRPDLLEARPTWGGGKVNATTVLLEPLTDGDSEALVANLLGSADVSPNAKDRIIEAAGGNPFFVEEIVSMLIDDGLLVRDGGSWLATADLSHVALPPTISALLAARLDRLEPPEREAIQLASVIGGTFSIDAVEGSEDDDDRCRGLAALPRPQGAAAARTRRRGRRRRLPVPAHPHPGRRVRGAPQTAPVRPARAVRRLAADVGGHASRGIRRDPRIPPGAGASIPDRVGAGR